MTHTQLKWLTVLGLTSTAVVLGLLHSQGALPEVTRAVLFLLVSQDANWHWWAIGSGIAIVLLTLATLILPEPKGKGHGH